MSLATQPLKVVLLAAFISSCVFAPAQVVISEFMAANSTTLVDDFNASSDWIEVYNAGGHEVNLSGWGLTDIPGNLFEWTFPSTNLPPGAAMVVFASERNRRIPGLPLHTSFKLPASGDFLALTRPDGTIASQYAPAFPQQVTDVSYGLAVQEVRAILLSGGSVGRFKVPTSGALGDTWTLNTFDDSTWTRVTNAVGFEIGAGELGTNAPGLFHQLAPVGFWRYQESGTNQDARNLGSLGSIGNGRYSPGSTNGVPGPVPPFYAGYEPTNRAARVNGGVIDVPCHPALNPPGPFTVEAWVRPTAAPGTACPVSSSARGSGRAGFVFYQIGTDHWDFRIGNSNSTTYAAIASGGTPVVGQWTHLVGVYDGYAARLYVNGTLVANAGTNRPFSANPSSPFRIGSAGSGSGTYPFAGDVDEVALYGAALSPETIAAHYEAATSAAYNFTSIIRSDVRSAMNGVNSSAYLRLPFQLTNAEPATSLKLCVMSDDGFAASLNGEPTIAINAPQTLAWNSAALAPQPLQNALELTEYDLTSWAGSLVNGNNVLALQGLNVAATNADFLLHVELEAIFGSTYDNQQRYFTVPTPGKVNSSGTQDLGPTIGDALHSPPVPTTNDNIVVTCRVAPALAPVTRVELKWRVMYGATNTTVMFDDGKHGDALAADGIYGAIISNRIGSVQTYLPGQMVRWFVQASDAQARSSRWPLFPDPANSAEYLGTAVQPGDVASKLPVIHLFVQNYANGSGVDASSKIGGRASVYYDGEFYDNVFMVARGNSTIGYVKKSHSLHFNREHLFRHPGPGGERIRKTSFTADYPDPTYLRQRLSMWLCEQVGAPGPFYHPVRLQMNGSFYQLANHNDLHGEELLERLGYDSDGALYNAAGTVQPSQFSTGGFDKKTRQWENNADYAALANAISESKPAATRRTNVFDLLDVPQVISYMVAARFVHENDDVWANMSLYHDNDGDGLWRIIPFDMNLSWGAAYMDSSVDSGIQVTNDLHKSFPMYGSAAALASGGRPWNRLYDVIFATPETRAMFLRRMRTVVDTYVMPPGTPEDLQPLPPMIRAWRDEISAEAQLDRSKWGWPGKGGQSNFDPGISVDQGVYVLLNDFLKRRAEHFYGKHLVTNTALPVGYGQLQNAGIPLAPVAPSQIFIKEIEFSPASRNQNHEYVVLTNSGTEAVDLSGWRIRGGVDHTLKPGTVLLPAGTLYLSPNVAAFRTRTTAPKGGMGLFVQGDYKGQLNAWGETLTVYNAAGAVMASNSFAGAPSDAQRYLRVTELMYNPAPNTAIHADEQQFEYIELKNISPTVTLNLIGIRFSEGVTFDFSTGAVSSLPPGQSVLVVRNIDAFAARYGSPGPVAGQFTGALSNGGETLRLDDASGEKILEFAYSDGWYPTTDGLGFSLVVVDETRPWDQWGQKEAWRPSGRLSGSPGITDPQPAHPSIIRISEVLAHTDLPRVDSIELYNPSATNVNIGGWLITDDPLVPERFRIPPGTWIGPGAYRVFDADDFGTGTNAPAFSEYGESACVYATDANGALSGYYHLVDFGASPRNVSFGRHVTSDGAEHFPLQSAVTLGTNNAAPAVGPVVISEIMYNPADPFGSGDEFIELQNITATNVPLSCTFLNEPGYGNAAATNTWRLRDAVDFDFPQALILQAGARIVVAGFDPNTNANHTAAFRTRLGIPGNVTLLGPWSGNLSSSGETVELKAPDRPDLTQGTVFVPYIMIDRIAYRPTSPWPSANGLGQSLQRLSLNVYGNDPINWFAAPPTPGKANAVLLQPFRITVAPAQGGFIVDSVPEVGYTLEYSDQLPATTWTTILPPKTGTGGHLLLTDPNPSQSQRFYRVRAQ